MNRKIKSLLAICLCVCLCGNLAAPVYAANDLGVTFSAVLDTPVIEVSETDQTVVMRVDASEGVLLESIGGTVVYDSPLTIASITNDDSRIDFSGSVNTDNGAIVWDGTDDLEQLSDVTNIAVVTFTVPANTPAGTYHVGIDNLELTSNYGDVWEDGASVTATLTITGSTDTVEGYTATVSTLSDEVSVNDTVTVNVGVMHSADEKFAAGEVILTYDTSKLTFDEAASTLGTATVKDSDGILTLEDYGADKNFGTGVYVLVFTAVADGETEVTLTSAAFVDKENAAKSDLIAATITAETVSLTISKETHTVTLPDIFTGSDTVVDGEDYTFSVADGDNYDYDTVTATMDGQEVEVIDNGDGTYTIENVTGELVITGSRTEKEYKVTFEGTAAEDITDGADTATYNTDYTFTMPTADGWAYNLVSITIGGVAYTGYSVAGSVYTIPGSAINGDIVITVDKSQSEASVTVEGSGAGAAAGYDPIAEMGESYTLTIVPEAGYTYTVTATMNGEETEVVDNGDNTYTIENVTGSIIFTVERTVVTDGVSVSEYLTLNGTTMWLVTNEVTLAEGRVPTYDGENMFWSENYGAYCYLVIAETLAVEDAAALVDITDGTAVTVVYDRDVNMTGKMDASDAQLVYNMYNASYNEFSSDVTVEKFLRADVNGDRKVNVEDATAIIAVILG